MSILYFVVPLVPVQRSSRQVRGWKKGNWNARSGCGNCQISGVGMSLCKLCSMVTVIVTLTGIFVVVNGVSVEEDLRLTLSQKKALDKFRIKVSPLLGKPYMKTDIYLIRWLRAKNFDVNLAKTMLLENLKWRKEKKMDGILQEDFSDVLQDFPTVINTHDKEGRPIGVISIGDWDIRRGVIEGRAPRVLRFMDYLMENVTTQVFEKQAAGMNVTQWRTLGSADGFNLVEHGCPLCVPFWLQFFQSYETHYPGWLHELTIIDAPPSISVILEAARPLLSRQTREALRIFGPNKKKWMPYFDSIISRDQRYPAYGGTRPQFYF